MMMLPLSPAGGGGSKTDQILLGGSLRSSSDRAGLNTRGPHTNVRRGPFLVREARIFLSVAVHFFSKKVIDDLFSGRYV